MNVSYFSHIDQNILIFPGTLFTLFLSFFGFFFFFFFYPLLLTSTRKMILLFLSVFLQTLCAQAFITNSNNSNNSCPQTCGNATVNATVPYPFGFSPTCAIPLNCSSDFQIQIHNFQIQTHNFLPKTIKLTLQPNCSRPLNSLRDLYTNHYAPSFTNAILLHRCSKPFKSCSIPAISVESSFQTSANCTNSSSGGANSSSRGAEVSCFNQLPPLIDRFLNYSMAVETTGCGYLLSSILATTNNDSSASSSGSNGSVSLEVQVMELEWWIRGEQCRCAADADCEKVVTYDRKPGFRCLCRGEFVGDGYRAGRGCQKASSLCATGKCGGRTNIGVLVGGVVAGAALMVSLGLLYCLIRRHSAAKARSSRNRRLAEATGISIPIYSFREIDKATESFSDKHRLGTGAYGTVYAGKLQNDLWVAIKKIRHGDSDSIEQVLNEIKLISSVSHPNLVRLMGCSIENGEQILVYEFMPNGTLCQHLQRERGDGLPWQVRLAIALETAQAIAHLHSAIDPPIFHRDIKSSNILLDYNFRSKVADFGLSRLGKTEMSHISTVPQGTPGYLDPQYHLHFHLSDKSDVYSFGVVLAEIISGMKVVDFSRPQNEVNLAALATDRIIHGRLEEIIDPLIETHGDAWTLSSVFKVAELTFRCLSFHRDMRPSMTEVAAELEQIMHCRWAPSSEETNCTSSSELSHCSSTSTISEKPLSTRIKKETGSRGLQPLQMENLNSPVSVQETWLSEQSSPSSSSLLSNLLR